MTQSHAPSAKPVSRGQAGKFFDKLWHKLDALGLKGQAWNEAFKTYGDQIVAECAAVVQKYVDMVSSIIIHYFNVDRTRSTLDALKACGRKLYVDESVAAAAPRGAGKKVKMTYFKLDPSEYENGALTCAALANGYKKRGLIPDPQAQIDDNAANPDFADSTPNACQWVDEQGNYCFAAFNRWDDERDVNVYRSGHDWRGRWSFGGVPEVSSASAV